MLLAVGYVILTDIYFIIIFFLLLLLAYICISTALIDIHCDVFMTLFKQQKILSVCLYRLSHRHGRREKLQ